MQSSQPHWCLISNERYMPGGRAGASTLYQIWQPELYYLSVHISHAASAGVRTGMAATHYVIVAADTMLSSVLQVPENELRAQKSVVGAVRVVCRSLSGSGLGGGLRRPLQHQRRASVDVPLRRVSMEVDDLHTRWALLGVLFVLDLCHYAMQPRHAQTCVKILYVCELRSEGCLSEPLS